MKIFIGCDHRGVDYQNKIKEYLESKGYEVGISSYPHNDTDDYPDFAFDICTKVINNKDSLGILLCGTGIGMSIAANKVKGILCGHCSSVEQAHLTREHNHANVIALSYKQDINEVIEMIKEFIKTEPSPEVRHCRRVNKILEFEK
jgi:ribose 5-phosphate isomerase B